MLHLSITHPAGEGKNHLEESIHMISKLTQHRKTIQLVFGLAVYLAIFVMQISLWIVLGAAVLLGAFFGKTFCKWMCPMGFIMEKMTSKLSEDDSKRQMYNYYKLGCPISWVQGLLNKMSLYKIKVQPETCTSCGLCDKACYITSLNAEFSFFKMAKRTPATAFNCSKCLKCVEVCPTNSIQIKI